MQAFSYYTPTKVLFGRDTEQEVGRLLKMEGASRVLIHYGGGSVVKSGLLDRVCGAIENAGISYVKLGGAVPNPLLGLVREGIALCKQERVDYILGVGGGSAIDSAKAIALGYYNGCDVWDIFTHQILPKGATPLGCIITHAATGTEMSDSTVITNEYGMQKRGFSCEHNRPRFAIMNPALTMTLSDFQTACGCVDILMHTMERYFTPVPSMSVTDGIAESLMRTVIHYAKVLKNDPQNYEARAEIMWAGSLSHNGLTGCGGVGDWASHQIEHELGGMYDVAHGAGLAAIWGSWARYVYHEQPSRFARFATQVLVIAHTGSDDETALRGIEAMEAFYRSINMPTNLRELGVMPCEEDITRLAFKCCFENTRTIGSFMKLSAPDIEKIYRMAR